MTATSAPGTGLRRTLGFWSITAMGVGIVIGAGIYVLIGAATDRAGPAVWLSFLLAAGLSALTGLSYAELAGMFPSAGAEYTFAKRAFNEFVGFVTGYMMVAANVIGAAAVSIGFAAYLRYFVDLDERAGALLLLAVLTLVVMTGVQRSVWLSVALAALQVGGLVLVTASGVPHFGTRPLLEGASVSGVLGGAALVFFAFIGFDDIVTLSEETKDAGRVIPRALLTALGISTVLYVLVAVAAVSAVGASALADSPQPLALVMRDDWGGRSADIVAYIALASTTNTTLLVLTAGSRLLFGMARDGSLPSVIATVGRRSHAPWLAAIIAFVTAAAFASAGDISRVASATDFAVYVIFITVNGSLVVLRFTHPAAARPFRTPFALARVPVLPVLGTLAAAVMLVFLERAAIAIGGAALCSGVGVWAALRVVQR